MNDLSTIRRFLGFGLLFIVMNMVQIAVVTAILLHLYWPLGLVVLGSTVPVIWVCLRNERAYTRLSRAGPGPDRRRRLDGRGGRARDAGHQVVRPGRRTSFGTFDARAASSTTPRWTGSGLSAKFWTFLEVIPSVTLIVVLGFGARGRRAGPADPGLAGRVHHLDAVVGLAGGGTRLPAGHGAGGDDGRRPDRGDLRRRERRSSTATATLVDGRAAGSASRRRLPLPGRRLRRAARRRTWTSKPGETVAVVGATGSGKTILTQLIAAAVRRDRRAGHHRRRGRPRPAAEASCVRSWPPRSRTQRCSPCRPGRT